MDTEQIFSLIVKMALIRVFVIDTHSLATRNNTFIHVAAAPIVYFIHMTKFNGKIRERPFNLKKGGEGAMFFFEIELFFWLRGGVEIFFATLFFSTKTIFFKA